MLFLSDKKYGSDKYCSKGLEDIEGPNFCPSDCPYVCGDNQCKISVETNSISDFYCSEDCMEETGTEIVQEVI